MIVRAFEVRAHNRYLVCDLASDLNKKLRNLQEDGWNIISVTATRDGSCGITISESYVQNQKRHLQWSGYNCILERRYQDRCKMR